MHRRSCMYHFRTRFFTRSILSPCSLSVLIKSQSENRKQPTTMIFNLKSTIALFLVTATASAVLLTGVSAESKFFPSRVLDSSYGSTESGTTQAAEVLSVGCEENEVWDPIYDHCSCAPGFHRQKSPWKCVTCDLHEVWDKSKNHCSCDEGYHRQENPWKCVPCAATEVWDDEAKHCSCAPGYHRQENPWKCIACGTHEDWDPEYQHCKCQVGYIRQTNPWECVEDNDDYANDEPSS